MRSKGVGFGVDGKWDGLHEIGRATASATMRFVLYCSLRRYSSLADINCRRVLRRLSEPAWVTGEMGNRTRGTENYGYGLPEVTFSGPNPVTFRVSPFGAISTEK